jgi:hypothetical protein
MDVALLSISIKEIILEKDSVGVPGVGTFIAELVPSTFSDKGYTINPPYRRLSFTRKATEDGLLAERMKEKYGITGKQLTDFLEKLKGILTERKSVELPGLGRLRSTRENHFFFVPDEDLDIWPAGFGLVSISLKNNQGFDEEISPRAPSPVISSEVETRACERWPQPKSPEETTPSPVISSAPSPVISSAVETRACERWHQQVAKSSGDKKIFLFFILPPKSIYVFYTLLTENHILLQLGFPHRRRAGHSSR